MPKKLLFLFAAFTSLCAVVVGLHSLFIDTESSLAWMICKVASAATVVGIGIVTWQYWRAEASRRFFNAKLLRLAAIWLFVLACASAAWTAHLARVTGDFEAWVIFINVAMIGQATLTFWQLWSEGHHTSVAR
ncbi:MAG: hypothetical protein ACREOI_06045 [bacterium]